MPPPPPPFVPSPSPDPVLLQTHHTVIDRPRRRTSSSAWCEAVVWAARLRAIRRIFSTACQVVPSGGRANLRDRSPMFQGHARLRAVERGQICAYPLGPRLPYMQPGAGRAHRWHAPGRKLDRECPGSVRLQRIGIGHALRRRHLAPPTAKDLVRAITPPCPIGRPRSSDTIHTSLTCGFPFYTRNPISNAAGHSNGGSSPSRTRVYVHAGSPCTQADHPVCVMASLAAGLGMTAPDGPLSWARLR